MICSTQTHIVQGHHHFQLLAGLLTLFQPRGQIKPSTLLQPPVSFGPFVSYVVNYNNLDTAMYKYKLPLLIHD